LHLDLYHFHPHVPCSLLLPSHQLVPWPMATSCPSAESPAHCIPVLKGRGKTDLSSFTLYSIW
jgi:hypothetical protein